MQERTYSKPDFDPYSDAGLVTGDPGTAWRAPVAGGPLNAHLRLPGSKSLTARELVLSALADGPSLLRAPLHSRDSALMVQGLTALGVRIEEVGETRGAGADLLDGADLLITPGELLGGVTIDCGLAGTVMRFLPPVAALGLGAITFDGDAAARRRPMRAIIQALRDLGVDVNDDGRGTLPFGLWATGSLAGGELSVDASESSQFVSGLLLAAPRFANGLRLTHTGDRLPSLPHIEMTLAALRARGVDASSPAPGSWVVAPGPIAARDVTLEPDLSNAAPFLAAALVAGGTVTIADWPAETTQVGAQLAELLPRFGATVSRSDGALVVDGGAGVIGGAQLPGLELDLSAAGELAPALVALAALSSGPSRFTGIGHLRGHETDRLAALAAELNGLGGDVTELDGGLELRPRPLHGGAWRTYEDHRMATAGAIVGLAVPGVELDDVTVTAKTLPAFTELWAAALGDAAVA